MGNPSVTRRDRKVHEADRFAGHGAAGPRNSRNLDGKIDTGAFQRTDRHLGGGFLADRAEGGKR